MDLTIPSELKRVRAMFGFDFKKSFGQNFLVSRTALEKISEAAAGTGGVLEIGPGFGTLTDELAQKFKKVVAIEIDKRLPEVLAYTLAEYDNVKIISGDCMKLDLKNIIEEEFGGEKISVAANLPYYITTPIITMLLESELPVSKMVVMVQKEVAERLTSPPGSKNYGAISVFCDYYTTSQIVTHVPAGAFVPPPKVDSAVVKMVKKNELPLAGDDEKLFFKVVRASFSQRRKTVLNCLSAGFGIDKQVLSEALSEAGFSPMSRGEVFGTDDFIKIAGIIKNYV